MSVPATAPPSESEGANAPSPGQSGAIAQESQRVDPTRVPGAETQEQPTRPPDYVREAFARLRGYTQSAAPAPQTQANGAATETVVQAPPASSLSVPESVSPTAAPPQRDGTATTLPPRPGQREQAPRPATVSDQQPQITLTQEEYRRQVQAEADRILAKRQAEEKARQDQEREIELRDTDPYAYARLMREKAEELAASQAETKRLTDVVATQLHFYDRGVLDPLVGALPEPLRAKVISKTEGIEGRKETATAAIRALRAHYVAEGKASARSELLKDQAFIKEILTRYGQAPVENTAPVLVRPPRSDASGGSETNDTMNAWMRAAGQTARATSGRRG